jgi:hypothetical protein
MARRIPRENFSNDEVRTVPSWQTLESGPRAGSHRRTDEIVDVLVVGKAAQRRSLHPPYGR